MKLIYILVLLFNFLSVNGSDVDVDYDKYNSRKYFAKKLIENLESSKIEISSTCVSQMLYYAKSLIFDRKPWAIQMIDAEAKIPAGLLTGNFVDLGFFDECLDVYDNSTKEIIHGKYCLGTFLFISTSNPTRTSTYQQFPKSFPPSLNVGIQLGKCFPSGCSAEDIDTVYKKMFRIPLTFEEKLCQTKEGRPELDAGDVAMISFLSVMLGIIVCSTVYDAVIIYLEKKPLHPILLAFSFLTNGKKLLTTTSAGQITCLHGIRVITMMWIILGHLCVALLQLPIRSYKTAYDWIQEPANMIISNSVVSVDTFFLLGGIVMVYAFMVSVERGVKFNIVFYYVHRYIRLTPLLAVIVFVYATIIKHMGSGAVWPTTVEFQFAYGCRKSWWRALLYIQNYGGVANENCITQTWYLSVDFQLFLVSPFLLLPLKRWPRPTLILIGVLTVCSSIITFLSTWYLKISYNAWQKLAGENYFSDFKKFFYYAPWVRCSPWLIGMIVGYVIFEIDRKRLKLPVNKFAALILGIASGVIAYACIWEGHDMYMGEYNRLSSSFHFAFVRPAWAIAVSWVILACVTGYAGPINWFLSIPLFQVLSKLTYSMYLTHNFVIFFVGAQMVTPHHFTNPRILYAFWSVYMHVLFLSTILSLAFESPMIVIEKVLFYGSKTAKPPQKRVQES